jgi:uncharacterized membrane protein YkvA (DUF1232 family)
MIDTRKLASNAVDESEPPDRRALPDIAIEAVLLLPNALKLLTRLVRDPRVSIRRKVPIAAAILYVMSPIDLIPDVLLGLGVVDDLVVMSLALNGLIANTEPEIILEHWDGSLDALDLLMSSVEWGATLVPGRR